ncbi:MAG: [FeFe] hydrogenase H-cluster radical SAM maturase HydG [Deltaproteobacteria bacterium]|nr:[FeFe] hydrogenase H-cluster radical SAM maturase HydG [Deltaproteobacteria bacterium]
MFDIDKIEAVFQETKAAHDKGGSSWADKIYRAIETASLGKGLDIEDAAALLCVSDQGSRERLYKTAAQVKGRSFGNRVVLFAPLYLSNFCTNGCVYCGFRAANVATAAAGRKALSVDEAVAEATALAANGFKRALLVTGEDARYGVDFIIERVKAIYSKTGIRIVHVNAPPCGVDELKELKSAGVGVYQSFQETYHKPTYNLMHPTGRKKDYGYRLSIMDRALEAGFEDVGIGALIGLYDFRFDCLAAIAHSLHLNERWGTHAHTVSVPRLRPADEWGLKEAPFQVSDEEMKLITAVYRVSLPTTGVVVSTREGAGLRAALLHCGASQLSAGSRTNPGGYSEKRSIEQFSTDDKRSLEEVMASIAREGFMPSLCTTCYRVGRVGHEFTQTTLKGDMERLCQANAILTLKEYIEDSRANGSRETLEGALRSAINGIKDLSMKRAVLEKLKKLEQGERDLFF